MFNNTMALGHRVAGVCPFVQHFGMTLQVLGTLNLSYYKKKWSSVMNESSESKSSSVIKNYLQAFNVVPGLNVTYLQILIVHP